MIAFLTALFSAVPEIISIVKTVVQFIKDEETRAAQKALAGKIADATKSAATTGDTSALENIFKSGNQS